MTKSLDLDINNFEQLTNNLEEFNLADQVFLFYQDFEEFFAELKNNSNYDDSTGPNNDTVLLKYQNPLISGRTGSIEYNITYGV